MGEDRLADGRAGDEGGATRDAPEGPCKTAPPGDICCTRMPAPMRGVPGLEGTQDLIAVLNDATSEVSYAQVVRGKESTVTMLALKAVLETHGGLLCALRGLGESFCHDPDGRQSPSTAAGDRADADRADFGATGH